MGNPSTTQVKNGLHKIFNFWDQNIDVSNQAVFVLIDLGLHYEEGENTTTCDPLTTSERVSVFFL